LPQANRQVELSPLRHHHAGAGTGTVGGGQEEDAGRHDIDR
jgi:hypothetical protein